VDDPKCSSWVVGLEQNYDIVKSFTTKSFKGNECNFEDDSLSSTGSQ